MRTDLRTDVLEILAQCMTAAVLGHWSTLEAKMREILTMLHDRRCREDVEIYR